MEKKYTIDLNKITPKEKLTYNFRDLTHDELQKIQSMLSEIEWHDEICCMEEDTYEADEIDLYKEITEFTTDIWMKMRAAYQLQSQLGELCDLAHTYFSSKLEEIRVKKPKAAQESKE